MPRLILMSAFGEAELAENMGTGLNMIDRHYYHFNPKKAADRLAGTEEDR